jgi:hypothetical protein
MDFICNECKKEFKDYSERKYALVPVNGKEVCGECAGEKYPLNLMQNGTSLILRYPEPIIQLNFYDIDDYISIDSEGESYLKRQIIEKYNKHLPSSKPEDYFYKLEIYEAHNFFEDEVEAIKEVLCNSEDNLHFFNEYLKGKELISENEDKIHTLYNAAINTLNVAYKVNIIKEYLDLCSSMNKQEDYVIYRPYKNDAFIREKASVALNNYINNNLKRELAFFELEIYRQTGINRVISNKRIKKVKEYHDKAFFKAFEKLWKNIFVTLSTGINYQIPPKRLLSIKSLDDIVNCIEFFEKYFDYFENIMYDINKPFSSYIDFQSSEVIIKTLHFDEPKFMSMKIHYISVYLYYLRELFESRLKHYSESMKHFLLDNNASFVNYKAISREEKTVNINVNNSHIFNLDYTTNINSKEYQDVKEEYRIVAQISGRMRLICRDYLNNVFIFKDDISELFGETTEDAIRRQTVNIKNIFEEFLASDMNSIDISILTDKKKNIINSLRNEEGIESNFEKTIDWFIDNLSKQLIQKKEADELCKRLNEFYGDKINKIGDVAFNSLITAEFLYHKYILEDNLDKSLDYSFISSTYYKALEAALNNIFYIPYISRVGENSIKYRDNKYFPNPKAVPSFLNEDKTKFKDFLTMGGLANLLLPAHFFTLKEKFELRDNSYPIDFINFITETLSIKEKREAVEFMFRLGKDIHEIKDNRNSAVHGAEIIDWETTILNRNNIFINDEIIHGNEYRKIINRLLKVL